MSNENLRRAREAKNDEFFTLYNDVKAELCHYKDYFKGKIVYCNCDTPDSNFVKFLNDVKNEWQIADVWHTSIQEGLSYDSAEARELLKKCDVVISNPPFSKTRAEYIPLLIQSDKQFLFIGNLNMATYKEVFPLIRDGRMWCGYTFPKSFLQPDGSSKKFGNIVWWTNLPVYKEFKLNPDVKYYGNEHKYPTYDNYAAINVDRLKDIPSDYTGCMGVPITFIQSYTPPRMKMVSTSHLLDSERERMVKTSNQTTDTTICDTLLNCRNDLYISNGGGQNLAEICTNDCSFRLVGHEHDTNDKNLKQFEVRGKGVYKRVLIVRR